MPAIRMQAINKVHLNQLVMNDSVRVFGSGLLAKFVAPSFRLKIMQPVFNE